MRRKVLCHFLILVTGIAFSLTYSPAQAQTHDLWAPFQFFLGDWSGVGSGKPGEAVGSTSFSFDLDKRVIVRKNRAELPPRAGEKSGLVHQDLMIIYQQPGDSTYRAIYFDNEAHVISYTVSFPAKQPSVIFESEGSDKAPRFRLIYEMASDSLLSIEFSIAPPGGEFQAYTKGRLKRSK
jgi:hypothetical protein